MPKLYIVVQDTSGGTGVEHFYTAAEMDHWVRGWISECIAGYDDIDPSGMPQTALEAYDWFIEKGGWEDWLTFQVITLDPARLTDG